MFLVFGKRGQLASALARIAHAEGASVVCYGRDAVDLADSGAVGALVRSVRPTLVVNAAAYTAVDRAEDEPAAAFALNRDGPAALAEVCAAIDVPLVHVSTDYVFDGAKPAPYVETDPKAPLNVYGRSKSEGEDRVLEAHPRAAVLRTSWVYGPSGANFVRTMLRLAATRDEVAVVDDQHGRPTAARDLAAACLTAGRALLDREPAAAGLFHYAGQGDASWADVAEAAFAGWARHGHRTPALRRIPTAQFPTRAARPRNSRLDTGKIERVLGLRPVAWREALDRCVDEIAMSAP